MHFLFKKPLDKWEVTRLHDLGVCSSSLVMSAPATLKRKLDDTASCQKLYALRARMSQLDLSAVIVGSADAHASEYVADCDKRRAFISGFTGSAGTGLITATAALLYTDGRYFNQAQQQLSSEWTLMRTGEREVLSLEDWAAKHLPTGATVGVDPFLTSASEATKLREKLAPHEQALVSVDHNLVDAIWGTERPVASCAPLRVHPLAYAGVTVTDKLAQLRSKLRAAGCFAQVISALDEVAWLLNIRGGDVQCSPVAIAYAVVTLSTVLLFIDSRKLTAEVRAHLIAAGVQLEQYEQLIPYLDDCLQPDAAATATAAASADATASETTIANAAAAAAAAAAADATVNDNATAAVEQCSSVLLDPAQTSLAVQEAVAAQCTVVSVPSPVALMKAVKNAAELSGMRACHIRDGVALTTFLSWYVPYSYNGLFKYSTIWFAYEQTAVISAGLLIVHTTVLLQRIHVQCEAVQQLH
jgi:Xaa-Pro aminopeptidase